MFVGTCYIVGSQLVIQGDFYLLKSIQDIRNGMTKVEVSSVLGSEHSVYDASSAPRWLTEVTGDREAGEYWIYFMGFPSRNLIIYFDENETVVFTTWSST